MKAQSGVIPQSQPTKTEKVKDNNYKQGEQDELNVF